MVTEHPNNGQFYRIAVREWAVSPKKGYTGRHATIGRKDRGLVHPHLSFICTPVLCPTDVLKPQIINPPVILFGNPKSESGGGGDYLGENFKVKSWKKLSPSLAMLMRLIHWWKDLVHLFPIRRLRTPGRATGAPGFPSLPSGVFPGGHHDCGHPHFYPPASVGHHPFPLHLWPVRFVPPSRDLYCVLCFFVWMMFCFALYVFWCARTCAYMCVCVGLYG